jgi:hypothetical protein
VAIFADKLFCTITFALDIANVVSVYETKLDVVKFPDPFPIKNIPEGNELFPVPPYGTETVDASHLPAEIFPTSVTCD